jgi:hypothetical protein
MAQQSRGLVDLIKTLDSRKRSHRFSDSGLINEPGLEQADQPDQFGLWFDKPASPPRSGVDESIYGRSSGVIGFRIFPNPEFGEDARRRWNPERYQNDPAYYSDPRLVRPYRVGVTCALCHVGPHPLYPPDDPEAPEWRNLSSTIGNQYLREGKVFAFARPGSFFREMLDAQPPGTSDTSRVATDHINNPSSINSIFSLEARLSVAADEKLKGGALEFPGGRRRRVSLFLKDGADSVGIAGAMLRVYVNEGLYSDEWLKDHDALLGRYPQRPFSVKRAFRNSAYWRATYDRIAGIEKFFLRLQPPRLRDAPGGNAYLSNDRSIIDHGRMVFAKTCASCHSSKQPPTHIKPNSPESAEWFLKSAVTDDFWNNNFLSSGRRYPVDLLKTNACRSLATNAARGHIWDDFSSETYKTLPSIGVIEGYDPTSENLSFRFTAPAGGPGYYRPPSLAGLWSSAPFLHNNALGSFTGDPSVAGRMRAFDDAIAKLLWPDRRGGKHSIWRTKQESFLEIPKEYLPSALRPMVKNGSFRIGPIPKGMPINIVTNFDIAHIVGLNANLDPALRSIAKTGRTMPDLLASGDESARWLVSTLMSHSKCPDLVEDRGHDFGTDLQDADKKALIEFLKTL